MKWEIKPSPATSAITGRSDACVSTTEFYQVDYHTGSSYEWMLSDASAAAPDLSGPSNFAQVMFKAAPWSGGIQVLESSSNGCKGDTMSLAVQTYEPPMAEAGSDVHVCLGDSAVLGGIPNGTGASASGGSGGYSYYWGPSTGLSSQLVAHPKSSPPLVTTVKYTLQVTDALSGCVAPPDSVKVYVDAIPTAPTTTNRTTCQGDANPPLTATGTNIKWYKDASLTQQVSTGNSYTPTDSLVGSFTYYATQQPGNCESPSKAATLTVHPKPLIASATAQDQSVCNSQDGSISITASGSAPLEYSIDGGTVWELTNTFNNLGNAQYPVAVKSGDGCISYGDTLTVGSGDQPVAPLAGTDATYCYGESMADLTAIAQSGGTLTWYTNPGLTDTVGAGSTFSPLNTIGTTNYYVTEYAGGCESPAAQVTIVIHPIPSSPVAPDKSSCSGNAVPDLEATVNNVEWFADAALTNLRATGNTFTTGKTTVGAYTYYTTQTENNCQSQSTEVTLTIKQKPAKLSVGDQTICEDEATPVFSASGSNIVWYDASDTSAVGTGSLFQPKETSPGSYEYLVSQTSDGCESPHESFAFTIYSVPARPTAQSVEACEGNIPSTLTATGTTIKWYDDPSLTTASKVHDGQVFFHSSYTGNNPGTYPFHVTQTVSGCESAARDMTFTIYAKPAKPDAQDTTICYGQTGKVRAVADAGAVLKWYDSNNDSIGTGTILTAPDNTVGNHVYSATQSLNGCESDADLAVLTINPTTEIDSVYSENETYCSTSDGKISIYPSQAGLWYSIDDVDYTQNQGKFTGVKNANYPTAIRNSYGCTFYGDTVEILDGGAPDAPTVGTDTAYCHGEAKALMTAQSNSTPKGDMIWYKKPTLSDSIHSGSFLTPYDSIGKTMYILSNVRIPAKARYAK